MHRVPPLIAAFIASYVDLLAFLTRRIGCSDRAADVLHDVCLTLLTSSTRRTTARDPRAYLFRVARNCAVDELRRQSRADRRRSDHPQLADLASASPPPDSHVLDRDRLRHLDAALSRLPPNARDALLLTRLEGLNYAEVAAHLGVSESMVAKYVARALRECRDHLRRLDDEA
ncbi:MAG: RNA polymerase sigma factor [Pseudomonadota bacterium]